MKLVADLHVHTTASGHAYSTLEEYVRQAKKIGLEAFAMTDHGPAMPGSPHYYHFLNMKMIPKVIDGVRVFRGCESNIINHDGDIDLDIPTTKVMDILIVSMHIKCGYDAQDAQKNTEVYLKAIKKYPRINIIGHPGAPSHPTDPEMLVSIAKENKVVIEINNSSPFSRPGSWKKCVQIAKEVKRQDWMVVLGSDSHFSSMLGDLRKSIDLIKEAGLSEEHVVNTSMEKINKYILRK